MSANKWLIRTIHVRIFETIKLYVNRLALTHLKIRLPTNYWLTDYMYNHLTVCKQSLGLFKNAIYYRYIYKSYIIYIKRSWYINNLQWFICHTPPPPPSVRCITLNYLYYWAIGLMSRVFANGLGNRGSIPDRIIPKTQKMVLDAALLSLQHYKVKIKGKVEQSWEWSSALAYTSVL